MTFSVQILTTFNKIFNRKITFNQGLIIQDGKAYPKEKSSITEISIFLFFIDVLCLSHNKQIRFFSRWNTATNIAFNVFGILRLNMDKLINIVEEDSLIGEISKQKLRFYLSKVKVWAYVKSIKIFPRKIIFLCSIYIIAMCVLGLQRQVTFLSEFA